MKPTALAEHRKWDKQRKRGHPLCDFCEERFYEMEDLISHIRDRHFLCDLCMTTGKFEVFREQWELLQHYSDAHHLCAECRAQQRISCFLTSDRLGLHRFQEHPNEVANDPNSWLPVSIQLPPRDAAASRRYDHSGTHTGIDRVGGYLRASDGTLVAEGTGAGVRFRRVNPSEWTGDDFPTLGAGGSTNQQPAPASTRDSHARPQSGAPVTTSASTPRPTATLASVAGRGRQNQLTADDFPSLPGSNVSPKGYLFSTTLESQKPQSVRVTIIQYGCQSNSADETNATGFSRTTCNRPNRDPVSDNWGPSAHEQASSVRLGVDQSSSNRTQQPSRPVVPLASDFPSLSNGPSASQLKSLSSPLPSYTAHKIHGVDKKSNGKKKRSVGPLSPVEYTEDSSPGGLKTKLRQQRNPDIRHALSVNPRTTTDEDNADSRSSFNHIQCADSLPRPALFDQPRAQTEPTPDEFPSLSNTTKPEKTAVNGQQDTAKNKRPAKKSPVAITPNKDTSSPKKLADGQWPLPPSGLVDTECILYAEAKYVPPLDADIRNRDLIRTVETTLFDLGGKTTFSRFADLSRRYSHRQLTASAYMEGLLGLLSVGSGNKDSLDPPLWIAPMIAFLPNIGLQRALLRVLQGQGAPRLPPELRQEGQASRRTREPLVAPPFWAKQVVGLLQCCRTCGQVCLSEVLR
ncbi:zinc finger protein 598 [Clonorchis sinensis]|uniref:Zinc finger protein 598 n=1 Tax=Clonorchis sinensis TaxID=79923 RepID=G7Y2L0_CLOSI|nr:zinc finger protein 598 [Clonorchis sinensis]